MKRRTRVALTGMGLVIASIGALTVYGMAALSPPTPSPAAPVHTASGVIQGTREAGLTVYRGIPYAAPPVGELRWRPPAPQSWRGTLDASHFKPACMQIGGSLPGIRPEKMSEDCLGLNVWTPVKQANEKLAVMVFIYGGHFTNGSSAPRLYWGDTLARKGVVVVTFNYRVGILGFLAHPELSAESAQHVSGNYALLDCIAALEWVRNNIAAFGGDPANVTLFGQSAGAYAASDLVASPLAKGLFTHVIAMSGGDLGTAGAPGGIFVKERAEAAGVEFARSVNAGSLQSLRLLPAQTLLEQANKSYVAEINMPNLDGYVLPMDLHASLTTGASAFKGDLMVGIDAQDGATTVSHQADINAFEASVRNSYGGLTERILARFPARSDAEATSTWARVQTVDVAWRTFGWAGLHRQQGGGAYCYVFSRVPPWPPFSTMQAAGHGAELPYLFGFPPRLAYFVRKQFWKGFRDVEIAEQMQTYWTQFARTGNPNAPGLPNWPELGATDTVLNFADSSSAEELPERTEFSLMDAQWQFHVQ